MNTRQPWIILSLLCAVALLLAGCETCKCVDEVPPPVEYGQL